KRPYLVLMLGQGIAFMAAEHRTSAPPRVETVRKEQPTSCVPANPANRVLPSRLASSQPAGRIMTRAAWESPPDSAFSGPALAREKSDQPIAQGAFPLDAP